MRNVGKDGNPYYGSQFIPAERMQEIRKRERMEALREKAALRLPFRNSRA